jgi:hypothetical protein
MPRTDPPGVSPDDLVDSLQPEHAAILKLEDRTVVWREGGGGETRRVVKLYRRRGRPTALRSRIFRFRTEREFRRLQHLARWGIPCTPPLGWAAGWTPEHGHHEVLVMEEVPGAVELGLHLADGREMDLAPLFRIVRRMHESGFCHQTLYAANVLVSKGTPGGDTFVMCDVPRSWTFPRSILGTSMARYDLLDLAASLVEVGVPPTELSLQAYDPREGKLALDLLLAGADPRGKGRRSLRDLAARIRWAGAWMAFWKGRQRPEAGLRSRRVP